MRALRDVESQVRAPGGVQDEAVALALRADGVEVIEHSAGLLFDPMAAMTKAGRPYRVYTPFYRRCLEVCVRKPLPAPDVRWHDVPIRRGNLNLDGLDLIPDFPRYLELERIWRPRENGAKEAMKRFLDGDVHDYAEGRDRPAEAKVSRLSAHLHFGEVSPHCVWHASVAIDPDATS